MGWYRAFGRGLFFAFPPEWAHRIAGVMLGLPLPWEWIGRAIDDPRLEVTLTGIPLRNPIGLAAGFDKHAKHLDALGKVAPFSTDAEREAVLAVARIAQEGGADGLTCANTRPVDEPRLASGSGGLSGRDLFDSTVRIVREVREATGGELPINACGGIFSPADALACVEAGATTVQIYTGMIYEGPGIVGEMTRGLAEELRTRDAELRSLVGA